MNYALETNNLTKIYDQTIVVDHVNLHIPKGKIYGLLGRNGAGKSTTMKMLLKLIKCTEGSIHFLGNSAENKAIYKRIGSMIEAPGFYPNLTAYENLDLLARLHENVTSSEVMDALRLVSLDQEKKPFSKFSLGMKQRLGIAAAIMHKPELLILDEPINGLDPIGILEIRSFLKKLCNENNVTILLSSHVLSEIEQLADIIGVMKQGKLIEEVDIQQLHKQLKQYIEITVSEVPSAQNVLKNQLNIHDYHIDHNTIRIFDQNCNEGDLNTLMVTNQITVTHLFRQEQKLEDYFEEKIGGGEIA